MPSSGSMEFYLIDLIVIFVACIAADFFFEWFKKRRRHGLNYLYCESCEESQITYKIPGRDFRLCKVCVENLFTKDPSITEEQKFQVRSKYKAKRPPKRKKGKR